MSTKRNGKAGMSLVELVIAISLLAVVLIGIYTVFRAGAKMFSANMDSSASQAGLRSAMMQISRQEREATSVTPDISSLTFTVDGESVAYTVAGGRLCRNGQTVANDISGISSSVSGKVLTVTLTAANGASLSTQMHID